MTRQNTGKTRPAPPKETRWKKGQSGNPGGRPKGLANIIRAKTRDGAELAEFALAVFRGQINGRNGEKPTMAHRMEALHYLSERGFGRVAQPLEHSGDVGPKVAVYLPERDPEPGSDAAVEAQPRPAN